MQSFVENAKGWEFDLLRSLSLERQQELIAAAYRRAVQGAAENLRFWMAGMALCGIFGALTLVLRILALFLGFGWFGALILEIVLFHRLLIRMFQFFYFWMIRPYLRIELYLFAKQEFRQQAERLDSFADVPIAHPSPST